MTGLLFLLVSQLLHFAQLVEWPDRVLPAGAPIVIGIVGEDPFGHTIDEMTACMRANGHPFAVRRLQWNDVLTNCQVVYISNSEIEHVDAILAATRGSSVLTVACVDRFAARGGMIEVLPVQGGFDFDVNPAAAAEAHLEMSSKLLQLARSVRGTGEGR
jgi:hypothetical protein